MPHRLGGLALGKEVGGDREDGYDALSRPSAAEDLTATNARSLMDGDPGLHGPCELRVGGGNTTNCRLWRGKGRGACMRRNGGGVAANPRWRREGEGCGAGQCQSMAEAEAKNNYQMAARWRRPRRAESSGMEATARTKGRRFFF